MIRRYWITYGKGRGNLTIELSDGWKDHMHPDTRQDDTLALECGERVWLAIEYPEGGEC